MISYTKALCSAIILLLSLSFLEVHALENSQAQDIRFNKAKLLLLQGDKKEAFRLIAENLKGPFHLDTVYFLVEYHYKKKLYLKSYRFLRTLTRNALPKELEELKYNSSSRDRFLEQVRKAPQLKKNDYSILQYAANKFYDFYLKKSLSPEYLPFLLNLSEKYHLINYAHNFRIIDTNYALSKIETSKGNIPKAVAYILDAYEKLRTPNPPEHTVSTTELQVVLAEILIKDGLAETGALIMKSAGLDKNISPELKEYIQTYSETIRKSFFNIIYDYQLKLKSNILQISDEQESLGAEKLSALNHHNHVNIYYQTQLSRKYSLVGGLDLLNESSLSQDAKDANFSSISADLQIKKYKSGNSLSSYNIRLDTLSGLTLSSLDYIQARSQQTLSYERFWLTPSGKWQYFLPVSFKQYKDRTATAFGSGLTYESFNRSRWFRLKYSGEFGLQMEGDSLGTTVLVDLNITNQTEISPTMKLQSLLSFHKQLNSNEILDYQQTVLGLNLSYMSREWKQFGLSAGFQFKVISFSNDTSYQMLDLTLGGKYNF